jgi:hypothetical protein
MDSPVVVKYARDCARARNRNRNWCTSPMGFFERRERVQYVRAKLGIFGTLHLYKYIYINTFNIIQPGNWAMKNLNNTDIKLDCGCRMNSSCIFWWWRIQIAIDRSAGKYTEIACWRFLVTFLAEQLYGCDSFASWSRKNWKWHAHVNQQVKNYEKIKGMMRIVGVSPAKDSEFIQAKHHDQIHCGVEQNVFQTANRLSFHLSFLTLFPLCFALPRLGSTHTALKNPSSCTRT